MEPRYELDEYGDLRLLDGEDDRAVLTIPANGALGILYDTEAQLHDGIGGTLLKHGPAELVSAEYDRHRAALLRADPDPEALRAFAALGVSLPAIDPMALRACAEDLEFVSIPVASLDNEMVGEINACLATSGRVGRLKERLEEIRTRQAGSAYRP